MSKIKEKETKIREERSALKTEKIIFISFISFSLCFFLPLIYYGFGKINDTIQECITFIFIHFFLKKHNNKRNRREKRKLRGFHSPLKTANKETEQVAFTTKSVKTLILILMMLMIRIFNSCFVKKKNWDEEAMGVHTKQWHLDPSSKYSEKARGAEK